MKDTNKLMSSILQNCPELTNAQIVAIAEAIEPLPDHIRALTDSQLLTALGLNNTNEKGNKR